MSGQLKKEALKRAVYQAICLVRSEEQAANDYLTWLESFDKENKFSLIRFVQSFSERHHLTDNEKMQLRNSLRSSLFTIQQNDGSTPLLAEDAAPLPLPAVNDASNAYHDDTIPRNPDVMPVAEQEVLTQLQLEAATFEALLNELFTKAEKQGVERATLMVTLKAYLKKSVLPVNTQAQFINWCLGDLPSGIERVVTMSEKASVIHHVYNALCEELGPVDADVLLSRAVEYVKLLPCADAVSPEQFL